MHPTRAAGLYAVIAAVGSVLLAPLLALSYFATGEGADELAVGTVSAWADPARDLAGWLLTWALPDRLYATYLQGIAILFPAVLVCGLATRAARPQPVRRSERWGWRIALTGYWLGPAGMLAASIVLIGGSADSAALNAVFFALLVPGMLFSTMGSTVLGVALIRARYAPTATPILLAVAFPLFLIASSVLGHNSLGMLPLFLAWGATGWSLWTQRTSDALTTDRRDTATPTPPHRRPAS